MDKIKKTAALFIMLLFFVGCAGKTESPDFNRSFVCTMTVEKGDTQLTGAFSRALIGCYTFAVTSPEAYAGLTFAAQNGNTTLTFRDITVEREGALPAASFFGVVTEVLDTMARTDAPQPAHMDETLVGYSGSVAAGEFYITYHRQTKDPVSLTVGDGITVMFYDIRSN